MPGLYDDGKGQRSDSDRRDSADSRMYGSFGDVDDVESPEETIASAQALLSGQQGTVSS